MTAVIVTSRVRLQVADLERSLDYYGTATPLNQLANINVPEPRMLTVQPFDPSSLKTIEKVEQYFMNDEKANVASVFAVAGFSFGAYVAAEVLHRLWAARDVQRVGQDRAGMAAPARVGARVDVLDLRGPAVPAQEPHRGIGAVCGLGDAFSARLWALERDGEWERRSAASVEVAAKYNWATSAEKLLKPTPKRWVKAQALITQISQTAVCNRHHTVEQRFCRWLLMSLDRLGSNDIAATQAKIRKAGLPEILAARLAYGT